MSKYLLAALAVEGLVLGLLWMMFQHKPEWYRPVVADDVMVQRAQSSSADVVDSISDQLVDGDPFDVTLERGAVNEWIASLPQLWPEIGSDLGDRGISDIAVSFDAGRVRVGAHFRQGRLQSIVSLGLALSISDDGSSVVIRLEDVRGGSLPMPGSILRRVFAQLAPAGVRSEDGIAGKLASALDELRSVDELFEGIAVSNGFVWPNGDRAFRISSIACDGGKMVVTIDPL